MAQWVVHLTHTWLVPGSKHNWCKNPVKMIHQPVIHLTPLRLVKEKEKSAERIGNNLYEITGKKRNLNM